MSKIENVIINNKNNNIIFKYKQEFIDFINTIHNDSKFEDHIESLIEFTYPNDTRYTDSYKSMKTSTNKRRRLKFKELEDYDSGSDNNDNESKQNIGEILFILKYILTTHSVNLVNHTVCLVIVLFLNFKTLSIFFNILVGLQFTICFRDHTFYEQ